MHSVDWLLKRKRTGVMSDSGQQNVLAPEIFMNSFYDNSHNGLMGHSMNISSVRSEGKPQASQRHSHADLVQSENLALAQAELYNCWQILSAFLRNLQKGFLSARKSHFPISHSSCGWGIWLPIDKYLWCITKPKLTSRLFWSLCYVFKCFCNASWPCSPPPLLLHCASS